jgi:hypothetical protein
MKDLATSPEPPLCPSCRQPASQELAGRQHGWECSNEACPEFGQAIRPAERALRNDPAELGDGRLGS